MRLANGKELVLDALRPAEKLRLENFELLNLISRMEQAWIPMHDGIRLAAGGRVVS